MTLLLALSAQADELFVPSEHETVAQAVAESQPGDTIWIDAATWVPEAATSSITLDHDLHIEGTGGRPVLMQGHPDEGYFKINAADAEVTLQNLEFDGGDATPALRLSQGELVLRDIVTRHTRATGVRGGAIQVEAVAENVLIIEDSVLSDSVTDEVGGGILASLGGTVILRRTTLERGIAPQFGGLVFSDNTSLEIEDSTLSQGAAGQRGGGVYAVGAGGVTLRRTRLEGNTAQADRGGGALYNEGPAVSAEDVWFVSNTAPATEGGGAVHHRNGGAVYTRAVFCGNASDRGGALRVHDGHVALINAILIGNTAGIEGDGLYLRSAGSLTLSHVSASSSAAWADGALGVEDSYLADHALQPALRGVHAGDVSVSYSAFWNNAVGDFVNATDLGNNVFADSLVPPPVEPCAPLELLPPAGSPLLGAGTASSDIGAFGGPLTWPDDDEDGFLTLADCDDTDPNSHPDGEEVPADGVDQDCDGLELCYADTDADGHGEDALLESEDLDCVDPGEAPAADDLCPGADDRQDSDGDGLPDGCDEPDEPPDETTEPPAAEPGEPRGISGPEIAIEQVGCGCQSQVSVRGAAWLIIAVLALSRRRA